MPLNDIHELCVTAVSAKRDERRFYGQVIYAWLLQNPNAEHIGHQDCLLDFPEDYLRDCVIVNAVITGRFKLVKGHYKIIGELDATRRSR